jgi:hypothetical protein
MGISFLNADLRRLDAPACRQAGIYAESNNLPGFGPDTIPGYKPDISGKHQGNKSGSHLGKNIKSQRRSAYSPQGLRLLIFTTLIFPYKILTPQTNFSKPDKPFLDYTTTFML